MYDRCMASDSFNVNEMLSELQQAAVSLHEMFVELKKAGFTREDALDLIAKMMKG